VCSSCVHCCYQTDPEQSSTRTEPEPAGYSRALLWSEDVQRSGVALQQPTDGQVRRHAQHTHTHTRTHTQTQTDTHTDRHTHRHRQTHTHIDTDTHTHIDTHTDTDTHTHTRAHVSCDVFTPALRSIHTNNYNRNVLVIVFTPQL